jgi:hypothetical protein
MTIEEIEKEWMELKDQPDHFEKWGDLGGWALKHMDKLIAVAKDAKGFDLTSGWLDGLIVGHEQIRKALDELERDDATN